MNLTKAIVVSLAVVGLGQAHAATPMVSEVTRPAPSSLSISIQNVLTEAEKQAATQALSFDDARNAALAAMQTVIIESGEQPADVQVALGVVTAQTRPGGVALDVLRGRVQAVAIECRLQTAATKNAAKVRKASTGANSEPLQPVSCAAGLSVASTGPTGGLGLFGPPTFTAGGSDYTPAP